jgi:hypothetical protein
MTLAFELKDIQPEIGFHLAAQPLVQRSYRDPFETWSTNVMGGASIAGGGGVGDFSTIGTNATILPNLKIGKNIFVGAGAVVTKNIEDYAVVVGVPAKLIKRSTPRFDSTIFD